MTELLILKDGENYIRAKDGDYSLCGLDKASVFPLGHLDRVREHVKKARAAGIAGAAIFKLHLEETPFETHASRDSDGV